MGYPAWRDFSILVYVAINLSICELRYNSEVACVCLLKFPVFDRFRDFLFLCSVLGFDAVRREFVVFSFVCLSSGYCHCKMISRLLIGDNNLSRFWPAHQFGRSSLKGSTLVTATDLDTLDHALTQLEDRDQVIVSVLTAILLDEVNALEVSASAFNVCDEVVKRLVGLCPRSPSCQVLFCVVFCVIFLIYFLMIWFSCYSQVD